MAPFPLNITNLFGQYGEYLVYLLIGFAFGYALEIAGFAKSDKLAGQFYFKDMTVLKVMFTAIVTAMVLLFGAVGLGILNFSQV
ncbi:MAG TPA: sulfurtransferase, partial [Chloroflexi bacterium]|nr:sulfurtransferase [Chloroflexota bacterium]